MDREELRNAVVRYGLLFLISVALVLGFWFHGSFYALGLIPLALVGGFATFLVLLALRAIATGSFWRSRPRGDLPLSRESGDRVAAGTQTLAILSLPAEVPPAGAVARAVIASTGQAVATVRIRDVRRRLVGDVLPEEAAAAGYEDLEEFRARWARGRSWNPREIVTLVEFRGEAGA